MNRPASSKYVPGLPSDDDIDAKTNENAAASSNSVKIYDGVADCPMNDADTIKNVKIRAKDLAQEKLLNKVADCVDGFLRDRLLTFPDDEIFSIANEIYHITDVKYNTFDSDDNLMIRATVLAQIDDNDIMNCLVRFFKERNEFKHQIEDLKRQIAEFPNKIILTNQKKDDAEELHIVKGDYEDAIKLCDEAIELNPYDYELYKIRGGCYESLKQYEKAIQDYSKAIELNPNRSWPYKWRGMAYRDSKQYEKAIQDYSKAIELLQNNCLLYKDRGDVYRDSKQYEKAIQDYSKAIELNPKYTWAYQGRAECYQALGDEAKAKADFAKADELFGKLI